MGRGVGNGSGYGKGNGPREAAGERGEAMDAKRDHTRMNFLVDDLQIIHAQDRTKGLRERLLEGDAKVAALLRDHFRLTYWEYQGQRLLPRDDA